MPPSVAEDDHRLLATLGRSGSEHPQATNYEFVTGDLVTEGNCVDDFIPIQILGRGAMGTVLLAVHRKSRKPFAVKVMSKTGMLRPRSLRRAQTELDVLARLDHPFLPTLHSHFESAGYSFLVLDYCSGGDLNALRHRQLEKRFSEAASRFYGAELILALERLHELGFVYRDLKPENVLLSDGGHVVLTDFDLCLKLSPLMRIPVELDVPQVIKPGNKPSFLISCFRTSSIAPDDVAPTAFCMPVSCGHARKGQNCRRSLPSPGGFIQSDDRRNDSTTTKTAKYFVGTEEYVAPELLSGDDYDFAVDWWAFGVLLYELVYGKTPFKGTHRKNTFFNILHKEPEFLGPWNPLQDLIRKLLVKEPRRRLGYYDGAIEVKEHAFFRGVQWDNLQHIERPPIVPSSITGEKILLTKGDQVSSDLETYMTTLEKPRRDSTCSSSHGELDQSSDEEAAIDSDNESSASPADQSSRSNSDQDQRLGN